MIRLKKRFLSELEELEKAGTMAIWMSNANREPLKAVKKVVKEKIRLTGSAGKA